MSRFLASRFSSGPALIDPSMTAWANNIIDSIDAKIESSEFAKDFISNPSMASGDFWGEEGSFMSMLRPYKVENGTLSIPVKGLLLHDFSMSLFGMATGYTYIRKAMERGMADDEVERIALIIDSGGGEVAGNFDLVDAMYAMRGQKPIKAFVNESAYSAAFSIASAADSITLSRTGGVGSVGVVTGHVDRSAQMEQAGVKVTFIHAGKYKVEGNPYEALSDDAKKRMQVRIDGLYNIFTSTVARNLGIDEKAVRDTEALTYSANDAIQLGFAHEISAFDDSMAAFSGGSDKPQTKVDTMPEENKGTKAQTFAQSDLDAARAEGMKAGATAERERISGILGCAEATDRPKMANHLAMNTSYALEDCSALLAASAKETVEAVAPAAPAGATSHFEGAMGSTQNPGIEAADTSGKQDQEEDLAAAWKQINS